MGATNAGCIIEERMCTEVADVARWRHSGVESSGREAEAANAADAMRAAITRPFLAAAPVVAARATLARLMSDMLCWSGVVEECGRTSERRRGHESIGRPAGRCVSSHCSSPTLPRHISPERLNTTAVRIYSTRAVGLRCDSGAECSDEWRAADSREALLSRFSLLPPSCVARASSSCCSSFFSCWRHMQARRDESKEAQFNTRKSSHRFAVLSHSKNASVAFRFLQTLALSSLKSSFRQRASAPPSTPSSRSLAAARCERMVAAGRRVACESAST